MVAYKCNETSKDQNATTKPGCSFTVPEAEIIRALYQSGCIIDEIEIDRRKQHMRISCINDKPFSFSI